MKRQPDDVEISILALFEKEPLNRYGAHRVDDILKQMSAGSMSEDNLTGVLSDMIHAGWLKGRIISGPGEVAADIVDLDITPEGSQLLDENEKASLSAQVTPPATPVQAASTVEPLAPKCFISYSWDSEDHKIWVRKLAEGLRAYHVDAILDQWSAQPGVDLAHFMEQVGESDFVVVVCTAKYAHKANAGEAGVGYEKRIITAALRKLHAQDRRIIPVLRESGPEAVPTFLTDLVSIDFTSDSDFDKRLQDLARAIFGKPECVPPPMGPAPTFQTADTLYVRRDSPIGPDTAVMAPVATVHVTSRPRAFDPCSALGELYGDRPFYAIWASPTGLSGSLLDTQNPQIQRSFRGSYGRGEEGYTLTYAASQAAVVQDGLRFSSSYKHLDLSDSGSMVFSDDLKEFVRDETHPKTIHPLPLIEYTLSFVQVYLALWLADCKLKSWEPSTVHLGIQASLHHAIGWELRPSEPGTGNYDDRYGRTIQPRPINSADLTAPVARPHLFSPVDVPDMVSLVLLKSIYSAFGYKVEDIPYLDPERLVFRF